ncbi:MAG TPA: hypothetical protein VL523_04310 [Terriglobia bacterium]|nr:hypothetical protein [Terriglobia bacterium]
MSVEESYQKFTNVVADEEITQELLGPDGRPTSTFREAFSYLILTHRANGVETLEENRSEAQPKAAPSPAAAPAMPVTEGFASMWLLFYPDNQPQSQFRFLGEQTLDGRKMQVVCFAERPGSASVAGRFNLNGKSAQLFYQGVAWIDPSSDQIARMRLDLLRPHLDVGLLHQTTQIQFSEFHVPEADSSLWLPLTVTVTTNEDGQIFRNRHRYSNYRLFTVKTVIKPVQKPAALAQPN